MRYFPVLALGLTLIAGSALAETKTVTVAMTEAQEVPPHEGKGAGTATFTIDTAAKTVSWKVDWHDLSSDANAAHIHGPASPTTNAGVVVNLAPNGMKMPLEGSAPLTDAQLADLMAGKDYINVHTSVNKGGEIRGQIAPGM